jgi:hypothetical protein
MDVRYAWFRYHCKGADKQGLWRCKTAQDIDASVSGKERNSMREMFNKALAVCCMLQGRNSDAEVDRIGVENAFELCKTKVTTHWGCDILANGNAAVRTVYQFMTGKSINSFAHLDIQKCKTCRQLCLDSVWVNPAELCQSDIRATAMNSHNDTLNDFEVESNGSVIDVEDNDEPGTGPITSVASAQQPVLRDTLPHTECFVCAICSPLRLIRKWAHYLLHYRGHLQDRGQMHVQGPEKDEVQVALGVKSDARKASKYAPVSQPYWKDYSPESKLQFLRRRILHRKILQTGDKIKVMFSESGECKIAVVLDPTLIVIQKAHYVKSVQFLKDDNVSVDASLKAQQVYVTSILQHWSLRPQPTHFSGGHAKTAASSARCAGSVHPTSPSSPSDTTSDTSRRRSKNSATADIMPKHRGVSRQLFHAHVDNSSPASQTALHQWSDSFLKLSRGEKVMLRDVSGPFPLRVMRISDCHASHEAGKLKKTIGTHTKPAIAFPVFQVEETVFVEEDFGTKFGRIYPSHIQTTLSAFDLDEDNRCFFICLGIATGCDPFALQCLFRSHAAYLRQSSQFRDFVDTLSDDEELRNSLQDHNSQILDDCLRLNGRGCFLILQHCWPKEFSNFRIIIIESSRNHLDIYEFSEKPNGWNMKNIYMRVHDGHFTLLSPIHNINWFATTKKEIELSQLIHVMRPEFQCPAIQSLIFNEFEDESLYVSCALAGKVPSEKVLDDMWLQATRHCGLEFDAVTRQWTDMPANIESKESFQMGSMQSSSWERVRNALLTVFNTASHDIRRQRRMRQTIAIPEPPAHAVSSVPCVFLDAGSEAGTGLFRMLGTSSITHVAGIEIQEAWFKVSVQMFRQIRALCTSMGFRMPAVTILRSCMLADHACVKYLVSIASMVWINNFVFDQHHYFSGKREYKNTSRDVQRAPLSKLLAAQDSRRFSLSANAAFVFARHFQGNTSIALYKPEHFHSLYGYHASGYTVEVNPTWRQKDATEHVTILSHYQQLPIGNNWRIQCATNEDIAVFHDLMQKWSESIPAVFTCMHQSSLYSRQLQYLTSLEHQGRRLRRSGSNHQNPVDCDATLQHDPPDTTEMEDLLGVRSLPHPFNNETISIQELTCFQTGQLMSSTVINEYTSLLAGHFSDTEFPWLLNFDPKKSEAWTTSDRRAFYTKHFKSRRTKFVFAINTGFHWVALKIDTAKRYIATMCAMQNSWANEASYILNLFSIGLSTTSFQHFSVHVPHQRNAVDCGPLCCLFMLFLSQNDVSSSTELSYESHFTANQMRMRMFGDIRKGVITPLAQ